ncbi:MAG: FtsX-like permease family protein [Oscillospiraceae bacterium]|nr:FtsX-like permease family protein [Oscillospiraceae bacterium]MDD4413534.1 FtsX-like permease family protein [Oscillospiraceae bacterium]
MKSLYFMSILWKNLSRRKISTIAVIILLTSSITSLVITQTLSNYIQDITKQVQVNGIAKRTLQAGLETGTAKKSTSESINKILDFDHVIAAYSSFGRYASGISNLFEENNNLDGGIILSGANNAMLPKIIKGKAYTDNDHNVGVIPNKFYPSSSAFELTDYDDEGIINGESLIDKTVTLKCDGSGISYSFKVIGIYDVTVTLDDSNVCYVPNADVYNINEKYEKAIEESQEIIIVVADDYKNMNKIESNLLQAGFWVEPVSHTNTDMYILIELFGIALSTLLLVSCSFIILISTLRSVKNRTKEIGLMKAIGYKNIEVVSIQIAEAIFLGIISCIIGVIISFIGTNFLHSMLVDGDAFWAKITMNINIKSIVIAVIITIFIPIVGSVAAVVRIAKLSVVNALAGK